MKKTLLFAAAVLPAVSAVPANATTVVECSGANCAATDENVILTSATDQANVTGLTNQSGFEVLFTSSGNTLNVNNGQSSLSAFDGLLESITVMLQGGATFQAAEFNLAPLPGNNSNEATSVVFNFEGGSMSSPFSLSGNGNNWFGIAADGGERLTGFTIQMGPQGAGVDSLRQLRFGGLTGAVPEPATWGMMLIGFGAMGAALRRRRRNKPARVRYAL